MSEAVSRNTKRIYKWDNLKCFLIVMVVIGHFVNQYAPISNTMKSLSLFIYSFHMPLFIFLSGLLQKKWDARHPFRWDKPIYYDWLRVEVLHLWNQVIISSGSGISVV